MRNIPKEVLKGGRSIKKDHIKKVFEEFGQVTYITVRDDREFQGNHNHQKAHI